MLIRRGHLAGHGPTDVRVTGGVIAACAPGLDRLPGEDEIDGRGGALLPGLHDHHLHLRALAATTASIVVGPPETRDAERFAARLREADRSLSTQAWIRCVGYHESVAGALDRWVLDRLVPDRPVRVQHRTGALWVLNSAAAALVGLEACELPGVERDESGRATGRLWRMDAWLGGRTGTQVNDLAAVSAKAAALGVTGFTDATPGMTQRDIDGLADAVRRGDIVQRLHCMAPAGTRDPGVPGFSLGPVKILLDDDTLPVLGELIGQVRAAHTDGRPVAVHCVTRVQLILTLAALESAGRRRGDRIEHGAVIPAESLDELRETGLVVVTQPQFVVERADQYLAEVSAQDLPDLWRLRSLLDAGVAVAASTDSPFGGADPWRVLRAATRRPAGLTPDERIPARRAIDLFLGTAEDPATPRLVAPGRPADLVLLRTPLAEALQTLDSGLVDATFVAGEVVYRA